MSVEAAYTLGQLALASSGAVLIVAVLRRPLRFLVGARAAYWLWLLVPSGALIVLLPAPSHSIQAAASPFIAPVRSAISGALLTINEVDPSARYATVAFAIWIAGALIALSWIIGRHRAFVRSLGKPMPAADGTWRSLHCAEPMLVGALRPRVILPADFEQRYEHEARSMVLAHEQAHLQRGDAQVNALAAGWLCLSWFNPLMYWAIRLLRADQELACDAHVLAGERVAPRRYADALLKTQLSVDSRRRTSIGCHWHSAHPLTERISMLKRALPGDTRRRLGVVLALALVASGSYAVRAAQDTTLPESPAELIALNLKWFINDADPPFMPNGPEGKEILLPGGGRFERGIESPQGLKTAIECAASLPSKAWREKLKASGQSMEGQIILKCTLTNAGRVIGTPTLVVNDGQPASIAASDSTDYTQFRVEFNASTSAERVAAARRVRCCLLVRP